VQLERYPEVGEDDLAGDALVVKLAQPLVRVVLPVGPARFQHGLHPLLHQVGVNAVGQALGVDGRHADLVERVAELVELRPQARVEVRAVVAHLGRGVTVRGDDQGPLPG